MRAGKRDVLIRARWLELFPPATARLRSSEAYARAVERHPADVALAHDVLDHQVVDSVGTQIVRPADVYLANVDGRIEAVGIGCERPGSASAALGRTVVLRMNHMDPPPGERLTEVTFSGKL